MKKIKIILGITAICLAFSCNRSESDSNLNLSGAAEAPMEETMANSLEGPGSDMVDQKQDEQVELTKSAGWTVSDNVTSGATIDANSKPEAENAPGDKIIRTADVGMELENYHKDKHQLLDAIKLHKAYVSREDERNETYRISNNMQIRVPNRGFDKLLQDLTTGSGVKNIDYKRVNAIDVGEEFTDIQTRLKTKKEIEQQYIAILRQAKTIREILDVKAQIGQIREDIEANEGRLRYLSNQISFSTIDLQVYQSLEGGRVVDKPGFANKMLKALQTGWNGCLNFFLFLTYLWPLWLIIGLVFYVVRKRNWFRRGRKDVN